MSINMTRVGRSLVRFIPKLFISWLTFLSTKNISNFFPELSKKPLYIHTQGGKMILEREGGIFDENIFPWARDFKNSGLTDSGRSFRRALLTAWAFGFKLHLIFHTCRVEFIKPGYYGVWRISRLEMAHSGFDENQPRSVLFSLGLSS